MMSSLLLLKLAYASTRRPGCFFLQAKKNKLSASLMDISSTTSCLHHRRSLSSTTYIPSHVKHRRRRSVHFVPADNDKFLAKALTLGADTIVLDLEDSVKDKQLGRDKLHSFLEKAYDMPGRVRTEILVRINPLSTTASSLVDWKDDIAAGFYGSDGFMIPKVESQEELKVIDDMLSDMEKKNVSSSVRICAPSTSASVMMTTLW